MNQEQKDWYDYGKAVQEWQCARTYAVLMHNFPYEKFYKKSIRPFLVNIVKCRKKARRWLGKGQCVKCKYYADSMGKAPCPWCEGHDEWEPID